VGRTVPTARGAVAPCAVLALAIAAMPAAGAGYDKSWYRVNYWLGEEPWGFTLTDDAALLIRSTIDPEQVPNRTCALRKGATYDPQNEARERRDHLQFVTYSKIIEYRVTKACTSGFERIDNEKGVDINFEKGDRWSFLSNISEGEYYMRFKGRIYRGGSPNQLFDVSVPVASDDSDTEQETDAWLGLICANGITGWILMDELQQKARFGPPHLPEATDE
jgi:hypothetical protein